MLRYFLQRFLMTLPALWLVLTLVFLMIHIVPGDPVEQMLGEVAACAPGASRLRGDCCSCWCARGPSPGHRRGPRCGCVYTVRACDSQFRSGAFADSAFFYRTRIFASVRKGWTGLLHSSRCDFGRCVGGDSYAHGARVDAGGVV